VARTNGATHAPERVRRRRGTDGRTRTLPDDGTRRRRHPAATLQVPNVADTTTTESGLTAEQLQILEGRLLDERARALRAIWVKRGDIEDHRETGSLDEVEMDIRMAERHSEFITLIEGALRRLRNAPEVFDVSEVSGARIPFERLEIVPWTRRLTEETDPFPG